MILLPTPLQELFHPLLEKKEIRLWVKRDDLIHKEGMGNKWRKMKYNLQKMESMETKNVITMGGAYSNHIAAVGTLTKEYNLNAIGIIRGDELNEKSNSTLKKASENGLKLIFVDRKTFRLWRNNPELVQKNYQKYYFLPEGGTNELAIQGCSEIISEIDIFFDVIAIPIGTGGTFAGLLRGVSANQCVVGVSTLKGDFIANEISHLLQKHGITKKNYQLIDDYHFGGYGKKTVTLINFIHWFEKKFKIKLDSIYTGKAFFAVWSMIASDKFNKKDKIVLVHTGGLQGFATFDKNK